MKKSLEDKREERVKEIIELTKQREVINARLNYLTGVVDSDAVKPTVTPLPEGFSITKEVETLFEQHAQLRILQATALLRDKFPQYEIDRRKVHSSLVYLVERGKAVKEEERGLFSRKTS